MQGFILGEQRVGLADIDDAIGADRDHDGEGGLIGGVLGTVTNDLVSDTTYSMITDVQISERLPKGEKAQSTTIATMQQGSGTQSVTRLSKKSGWMQYRTRIVSTADKVNLKFTQAKPVLERQLAHSIASIF